MFKSPLPSLTLSQRATSSFRTYSVCSPRNGAFAVASTPNNRRFYSSKSSTLEAALKSSIRYSPLPLWKSAVKGLPQKELEVDGTIPKGHKRILSGESVLAKACSLVQQTYPKGQLEDIEITTALSNQYISERSKHIFPHRERVDPKKVGSMARAAVAALSKSDPGAVAELAEFLMTKQQQQHVKNSVETPSDESSSMLAWQKAVVEITTRQGRSNYLSDSTLTAWDRAVEDAGLKTYSPDLSLDVKELAFVGDKILGAAFAEWILRNQGYSMAQQVTIQDFGGTKRTGALKNLGIATMLESVVLSNRFLAERVTTILPGMAYHNNVSKYSNHSLGTIVEAAVATVNGYDNVAVGNLVEWLIGQAEAEGLIRFRMT